MRERGGSSPSRRTITREDTQRASSLVICTGRRDLNPKGPRRGERVQWTLKQPCVQASCKGSRRTADSRSEYVGVPPGKILNPAVDRHVLKHCGPDLGRCFKIVKGLFLAAILFLDIWKRPNFKARKIKDLNSSQFGRFGALPF